MKIHQALVFLLFNMIRAYVTLAEDDTDAVKLVNVGVILDMDSWVGILSNSCMHMAISDFYATHPDYKTKLVFHTRDSKSDAVGAVTADDHSQVIPIASIAQAFRWRKVILIHEDSDYGDRLVPHLIDAFQDTNTFISYRSVISAYASDDQIIQELKALVRMRTSVFIVHMSATIGGQFFRIAKQEGMMTEGYVWIVTNGIMNVLETLEPAVIDSMQGVIGVTAYIPPSEKCDNFIARWKRKFSDDNPDAKNAEMVNFGLWAYDTVWALAMAAERVGHMKPSFFMSEKDVREVDLLHMRVSPTGHLLSKEILKSEFQGLSGKFYLKNRQLETSAFQILNVVGEGGKEIGFWTSKHGISRTLNGDSTNSISADHFGDAIVWPGNSKTVPKGWVIPMNGRKLRIGVPVQDGFSKLVNVSGYSVDVFESAVAHLPYPIPYELVPFQREDGKNVRNYNDLIDEVYFQNYDAMVGDITITANRSLYVDFAFPYTNGVWMIVPLKGCEDTKYALLLFHPVSTICMSAFIFAAYIVWMLERGLSNNELRVTSYYELVRMIPFFIFSTIPLAYRKKVSSTISKVMVLLWLFLILGLTSNYLITLRSMLIVERLKPTITDSNDLIKSGDFVGYRKGTFVIDLLKRFNFDRSKLVPYSSPEECHELLSKGSQNGGVSAVFEEMPYVNIFLTKFCSKYTKVGPTYKSDGFGFVFQKGSPLVSDISKAVLEVTEGNNHKDIERAWFSTNTTCNEDQWADFISKNRSSLLQISLCVLILSLLITSSMFASYLFEKSPPDAASITKKKQ